MKAANSSGPKTEPCGTPAEIGAQDEKEGEEPSGPRTLWDLPERYDLNQFKAELEVGKLVQQSIVAHRVEGFREIKEYEQGDHSTVNSLPDIVSKFDECSLSTIAASKACLERIEKMMMVEMRR